MKIWISIFFHLLHMLFKTVYLFIFGCARSPWLQRLCLVSVSRGSSSGWCAGFSLQWFLLLQIRLQSARALVVVACGLSIWDSWVLEHRLNSCGARASLLHGMWDLPGPGNVPVSPSLAGSFFPTSHQGIPPLFLNKFPCNK